MKTKIIVAIWLLAGLTYGQWVPVSANTNSGEVKPTIFANRLNLWTNSVTSISNQFEAIKAKAITNMSYYSANACDAYVSNLTGYVVFGTNFTTFPNWYVPPADERTNAVLWYSFDAALPAYIPDITGNGNNGHEVFAGAPVDMWTNYAYRISSTQENYIQQTNSTTLLNGASEFTAAMWLYQIAIGGAVQTYWTIDPTLNTFKAQLYLASNTNLIFYFNQSLVNMPTNAIPIEQWNRIVCTYKKNGAVGAADNSRQEIWVNGTNCVTRTNAANVFLSVTNSWFFGSYFSPFFAYDAMIDDCVLDPTAWSSNTIVNDYAAGRSVPRVKENAILWYPFDTSASYVSDISGSNSHGREVFGGAPVDMWTNYAYRISSAYENYIKQTNSVSLMNGQAQYTVAMWLNRFTTATTSRVFWEAGLNTTYLGFLGSSNLYFYHQGYSVSVNSTPYLPTQTWNRIVCTYQKNGTGGSTAEQAIWINGARVVYASNKLDQFLVVTNEWVFGGNGNINYHYYDAMIDDPVIATSVWSSNSIVSDYAAGRSVDHGGVH